MSNIRLTVAHPFVAAWPLVSASIEAIQAKRPPAPSPVTSFSVPAPAPSGKPAVAAARIASLHIGERMPIFGNPYRRICEAHLQVSGKWKAEHVAGSLWAVERTA